MLSNSIPDLPIASCQTDSACGLAGTGTSDPIDKKREVVVEKSGVLIHRDEGARDLSQGSRDGRERADHQHHAAGVDRAGHPADRQKHVRERERGAAHQAGQHRDARGRPVHELPLLEQTLGQFAMPAEQVVGQHVRSDFLRGARLDEQVAQIFALALFGRLLVEIFVETRGHATLERQRKPGRRQREHHQHPVQAGEESRHQDYRHDVARESQHGPREIAGSPGNVALGAREAIVPVGIIEVAEIDLGRLREQPPLGFELHAADEQIPAVAHVGAHGSLHGGGQPQSDQDGNQVRESERMQARLGDAVDQGGAQVDRDGRHRGAQHPEHGIADQRTRRGGPGKSHALPQVLPDSAAAAFRRGRAVRHISTS